MTRFATPEEAARGDVPARFVRVIGVVVRGDTAIVAQLMNDKPSYEVETAYVFRDSKGWMEGSSGNSTSGVLDAGGGMSTVVLWDQAPTDAVAARFGFGSHEQVVQVEDGVAFVVFDEIPEREAEGFWPRPVTWIRADATEYREFDPGERADEMMRKLIEGLTPPEQHID